MHTFHSAPEFDFLHFSVKLWVFFGSSSTGLFICAVCVLSSFFLPRSHHGFPAAARGRVTRPWTANALLSDRAVMEVV
jgi:hypothetical protein